MFHRGRFSGGDPRSWHVRRHVRRRHDRSCESRARRLATVFIHHTSASLIVCENADPSVRADLEAFAARLVPDGDPMFTHDAEGDDDMPAHVRTVLTQTSIGVADRERQPRARDVARPVPVGAPHPPHERHVSVTIAASSRNGPSAARPIESHRLSRVQRWSFSTDRLGPSAELLVSEEVAVAMLRATATRRRSDRAGAVGARARALARGARGRGRCRRSMSPTSRGPPITSSRSGSS